MAKHQKNLKGEKASKLVAKKNKKTGKHGPSSAAPKTKGNHASGGVSPSSAERIPTPSEILEMARSPKSPAEIKEVIESANPFENKRLTRPDLNGLPSVSQRLPIITASGPSYGPKNHGESTGKHGRIITQASSTGKHGKARVSMASSGKHGKASQASSAKGKHGGKSTEKPASAKDYSASEYVKGRSKAKKRVSKRKIALMGSGSIAAAGALFALIIVALAFLAPGIDENEALESSSINVSQDNQVTDEFIAKKEREERQKPVDSGAPDGSIEARLDQYGAFSPTKEDIASIPANEEPFAFALDEEDFDTPTLSSDSVKKITSITKRIKDADADASYVLIDLNSGRGIAGNIDKEVYGASSFKGIFCAYLCEEADKNKSNLAWNESAIESVVLYSDNDAYDAMRASKGEAGFSEWLASIGLKSDSKLASDWYPMQSARVSSTAWLHVNDYLNSGSENAKWINDLFGKTRVSFIRDAIGSKDVTVRNKAGWYAATAGDFSAWNGTCDAGLIDCNGHTYILSVMTSLPTSDKANAAVSELAAAIWNAREDLA